MTPRHTIHQDALAALQDAVGAKWVESSVDAVDSYRDPFSVQAGDPMVAAAVVRPGSVAEVQQVVRLANRYRLALWPVSRGRNLAYGGAAPRHPGSVVLDMGRMNRILEVNQQFGYAVVEPGVTFADLHARLVSLGGDWWADVPDLEWGSVLGNALERGNGYTPYGDHAATQCGMEVVLPDGSLLRTGTGALPGSSTWHLAKYGFGPYLDGLFTQSNLGIVTRIGVHLMPRPPGYRPYMIILPREEDIGAAADILGGLRPRGTVQNTAAARSLLLEAAASGAARSSYADGPGPVPAEAYPQIARDLDIGAWNLYGAQYGSEPLMDLLWRDIREAFSVIPGARFCFADDRPPGSVMEHRAARMAGVPGMEDLRLLEWTGPGGGHINFSPISPASSGHAVRQVAMASAACREFGVDYMGDVIVGGRELHHIVLVVFDTASAQQRSASLAVCQRMIADFAAAGYGEYRTHLSLMDQVMGTYDAHDGALLRFLHLLKDAVDPNGVIAPGKSGIWPAGSRPPAPPGGPDLFTPQP